MCLRFTLTHVERFPMMRARRLHDLAESKGINSRGTKDIFG